MNRNYGKLANEQIEYAPETLVLDGKIVTHPSEESYLAAGWKKVVDEKPAPEPGCAVCFSGWEERGDAIVCIYKQVEVETPARVFSKLKIVEALKAANMWVLVKTWIEEKGYYDYYVAAQNFRDDNPLFNEAVAALKAYAHLTDERIEEVLSKCIYEGD